MSEETKIGPDTAMSQVLDYYPGAQRALFAKYHIGGCASCGFRPDETLGGVCERNENIPVDEAMAHIAESHANDLARQVQPLDLKTVIEADEKESPALLDLRTREEFENAKIAGAELFSHDKLQDIMGSWPKDRAIVIYDHRGESSCMDAAAYLEGHGFENVRTLCGGIDAYAKEADPSLPRYRLEIA
ncbi:MAG: rhodanese-related sulfurtransferase [Verrucomicrobiales bacterium]|jgi:rhodanese-related sulfurtransferase